LIGAEAEQRGNVADLIQCRLVPDEEQLHTAPDGGGNNGLAHIFKLARGPTTQRTISHHVRIEVTAAFAFDRVRGVVFRDQQSLHLPHLQRPQDTPQAGDAISIASGLAENFVDQVMPVVIEGLSQDMRGLFAHLLLGDRADIRRHPSQQSFLQVGMEMRLELMPIDVLASDDEIVEGSFFLSQSQVFSHVLIVVQDFIVHATLGVTGVISGKPVTTAAAGQSVKEGFAFLEFVKVQIKDPRPVAVHESKPQMRLRAHYQNQWLKMKAAVNEKASVGKLWRQVEFAPDVAAAAGKHNFGGLASVPCGGQIEHTLQGGSGAAIAAVLLRLTQRLANQILGQNNVLTVRLILWPGWLKIETYGAIRAMGLEFSQLNHLFASDHSLPS